MLFPRYSSRTKCTFGRPTLWTACKKMRICREPCPELPSMALSHPSRYHRAPQLTETECVPNHGIAVPPASVTVEASTWTRPPIPVTKRPRFLMSVRIKACAPALWTPSPPPSSALVCLASALEPSEDVSPVWPALQERGHCAVVDVDRRPCCSLG